MKVRFLAFLLLFTSMAIISCSKDDANPQDSKGGSLFVKMQQGIIPGDDTVFLVSYDENNRITKVINSTHEDTLIATYNSTGHLISTEEKNGQSSFNPVVYSYNTDNQLTEVYLEDGEYSQRFTFEYTNGVISKKSFYTRTNLNSPTLNLWKYHTYVVTNGNITNMKEYNSVSDLLSETTFTYTSDPNVFKPISLLNFRNILGLTEVANYETHFNKNLIASSSAGGIQTTYTYTYNSNDMLGKFIVSSPDAIYTRMLSY